MVKLTKLLLLVLLAAIPAWPQALPTTGALATSADNTTRPVIVADHWTLTQTKNTWTLGATGLVGNGSSCTATVSSDPTSGSPRIRVGGTVTTAAMADSNGNQTKKTVTAVNSTTITFSCTFNGTTGSGTISSDIWPEPAIGASFSDPDSTYSGVVHVKLIDESGVASATLCRPLYRDVPLFNITQEYGMVSCGGRGIVIINKATNVASCNGIIGSEDMKPRWTRDEADPYKIYYTNSFNIREMDVTSCTTSVVKSYSGTFGSVTFSSGGRLELNGSGQEVIGVVGCASGSCPDNGEMSVFIRNITAGTDSTAYVVPAAGSDIDELHIWPISGKMLINYTTNGTGTNQGVALIDAAGAFEKKLDSTNRHLNVGVRGGADVWYYNENSGGGPAGCTNGVIVQDTATQTNVCFFNKSTADFAGTGSCASMSQQIAVEGAWVALSLTQESTATPESFLGSAWNTAWCRGANENWICRASGTLDGTNNCRRLGHRWTSQAETDGSGSIYNRSPFIAMCMQTTAQATAGDVPDCISYGADFRLATGNGTTTLVPSVMYTEISTSSVVLISITPDEGDQNTVAAVTLAGTGMGGASPSITVSGADVTVSGLVQGSSTSWTANFTIGASAATGARNVTVTTADGTSNAVTFTVTGSAAPTLTSSSVSTFVVGNVTPTTLTGTSFDPTATVAISGTGVTGQVFYVSSTSLSVTLTVTAGATVGPRTMTVTTDGGTSGAITINLIGANVTGYPGAIKPASFTTTKCRIALDGKMTCIPVIVLKPTYSWLR